MYFVHIAFFSERELMFMFAICRRPSVCLSICLSASVVCNVRAPYSGDWNFRQYFYIIRKIIYPSCLRRRMVGRGATPSTWNFGSTDPCWSEIAYFQPIFVRSSSAVTPSEKSSIIANKKSTTRFPMSLRRLWYVSPKSPKGGLKRINIANLACVRQTNLYDAV